MATTYNSTVSTDRKQVDIARTLAAAVLGLMSVGLTITAGCRTEAKDAPNSVTSTGTADRAAARADLTAQINWVRTGESTEIRCTAGPFTDDDVQSLAGLTPLITLELPRAEVSDAACSVLQQLTNLQVLVLGNTEITDAGLAKLAELKSLRRLNLNACKVVGPGLESVGQLQELELFRLGRSRVTSDALRHLTQLPRLTALILQNADIRDDGLSFLLKIKTLESLYLEGNNISAQAEREFLRQRPIHWH